MSQLLPVLCLAIFVIIFGCVLMAFSELISTKAPTDDPVKHETYECGIPSDNSGNGRISIKFYLTAILFILFDIEIIFMYPWALTYGDFITGGYGLYTLCAMGVFMAIFIFGLFWEVKSKALEWE